MAARLATALWMLPLIAHGLEGLDDQAMSDIVAQDGVVLRSEYDVSIDSIQYFDDDSGGVVSLQNARIATHAQQVIDVEIVSETSGPRAGRSGIRLTTDELPFEFTIDDARINGRSIGRFGLTDFTTGGVSPIVTNIWAGGYDANGNNTADESGFTVDVSIPKESSYQTYYEDDGTRLSATVDYCASTSGGVCASGGLNLQGLTVDVVGASGIDKSGVRVGVPTIQNGVVNIRNFQIGSAAGSDQINDISFQNINVPEGGYVILSSPDTAGEVAINLDAYIAPGTSFDYVFFDTSDSDVQRVSASVAFGALPSDSGNSATNYFFARDLSVNVLEDEPGRNHGIKVDIGRAGSVNPTGIRGSINMTDISLRPDSVSSAPVLGSARVNLEILPGSYVEVLGR